MTGRGRGTGGGTGTGWGDRSNRRDRRDRTLDRLLAATGATFVFAAELFLDLGNHLDAACFDPFEDRGKLRGFRLEIRERGEDLEGCHVAPLANPSEKFIDVVNRHRW